MKKLGKIGRGNAIHVVEKSIDSNGREYYFSICGADHCTNRSTSARAIGDLDFKKVTCKKCSSVQSRERVAISIVDSIVKFNEKPKNLEELVEFIESLVYDENATYLDITRALEKVNLLNKGA
jgi:hypothetical protein